MNENNTFRDLSLLLSLVLFSLTVNHIITIIQTSKLNADGTVTKHKP